MGSFHHKPCADFTPRQIEIIATYKAGRSLSAISELYEINPATIHLTCRDLEMRIPRLGGSRTESGPHGRR